MSIASPAEMSRGKQERDLRSGRRYSLMTLFSNSSVPVRQGPVQSAQQFGLVDVDTDTQEPEGNDKGISKRPLEGGIAGSLPEDVIRKIATLLSIADVLNFSLTVSSPSLSIYHPSFSLLVYISAPYPSSVHV